MTHRSWLTLSQNSRSLTLTVWEIPCFENIFTKDQWDSYEGVCRTAPDPGYTGSVNKSKYENFVFFSSSSNKGSKLLIKKKNRLKLKSPCRVSQELEIGLLAKKDLTSESQKMTNYFQKKYSFIFKWLKYDILALFFFLN